MRSKFIFLFVLLNLVITISAEQTDFYINPEKSKPFFVSLPADVNRNLYTFYIENRFNKPVFGSKQEPKSVFETSSHERFFMTEEDYYKPGQILLHWDFRRDNGDDLYDDQYILHLIETPVRRKSLIWDASDDNSHFKMSPITRSSLRNEHVYRITLDRKSPFIVHSQLSSDILYRNCFDSFYITVDKRSDKANIWRVVLDHKTELNKIETKEGKVIPFPSQIDIPYSQYRKWSIGKHCITVYALDCAGNEGMGEDRFFEVREFPFRFSIIANDGIVRRLNGRTNSFRYAGVGISGVRWQTKITDSVGTTHFSAEYEYDKDSPCSQFIWDGISSATNAKVDEGSYTAWITCTDSVGTCSTRSIHFTVSSEQKPAPEIVYIVRDANYGKPPFLSGEFDDNNGFRLKLINYEKNVSSSRLVVSHRGKTVRELEIYGINEITWDGRNEEGQMILTTGNQYTFELHVISDDNETDEDVYSAKVRAGLLTENTGNVRQKILVESIHFDANRSELLSENKFFLENSDILQRIARSLRMKLTEHDVVIVSGNANYLTYPNKQLMTQEESQLIALSRQRADIVRRILIFYGLPEKQVRIEANGGAKIIVPPNSRDNWKNRRVEFYIEKGVLP